MCIFLAQALFFFSIVNIAAGSQLAAIDNPDNERELNIARNSGGTTDGAAEVLDEFGLEELDYSGISSLLQIKARLHRASDFDLHELTTRPVALQSGSVAVANVAEGPPSQAMTDVDEHATRVVGAPSASPTVAHVTEASQSRVAQWVRGINSVRSSVANVLAAASGQVVQWAEGLRSAVLDLTVRQLVVFASIAIVLARLCFSGTATSADDAASADSCVREKPFSALLTNKDSDGTSPNWMILVRAGLQQELGHNSHAQGKVQGRHCNIERSV